MACPHRDYETESGAPLEYRLGVTTTGVTREKIRIRPPGLAGYPVSCDGPDGELVGASCALTDPWIDGPGGSVVSEFACAANVGTDGSGYEMPFAALELALGEQSEPGGPNEGFYRKDESSLLVVVLITDEDDCSIEEGGISQRNDETGSECSGPAASGLYPPEDVVDFLVDLTGDMGRFVVIGIGGLTQCHSEFGDAVEAARIHELIDLCADYGVHGDICAADLSQTLEQALSVMQISCDSLQPPV
jgi:hypothetical protein